MKSKLSRLLILILALVTLQGCSNITQKSNVSVDDSIIYAVESFPSSIDITDKSNAREKDLIYSIFDGLVNEDRDGNIVPALAESYLVSKDGLEYTFKLRDNIYWSDGSKITANDFLKFFKSIISSKNSKEYVKELYNVYGVKDYHQGKGSFEKNVAISKENDNTLKFRMNKRDDNFIKVLAEGYYKLREINTSLSNYKKDFSAIKYSGAYSITKVNDDKEIELTVNGKYWNKKSTNANKIIFKIYSGAEMALADFESKKNVDVILDIPDSEISRLASKNLVEIFPNDKMKVIEFNPDSKNKKIELNTRRALEKAILNTITANSLVKEDRFQLAQGELDRKELKSNESIVSSSMIDYSKNLDSIKEQVGNLLTNDHYEGSTLRLICLKNDENKNICEFISKGLKDTYNITLKYNLLEQEELAKAISNGEYELLLEDINSDSDVDENFLATWSANNKSKSIENNDIKNILSLGNLSNSELQIKSEQSIKLLRDNDYFIPLLYDNLVCVKSDRIKGITFTKDGVLNLNELETYSSGSNASKDENLKD